MITGDSSNQIIGLASPMVIKSSIGKGQSEWMGVRGGGGGGGVEMIQSGDGGVARIAKYEGPFVNARIAAGSSIHNCL